MIRVTSFQAKDAYHIGVRFSDGTEGSIDLSAMLGHGVFQALADPRVFAQVFVDPVTHTVAWPNGIDLCPDTLYRDIQQGQRAA